MNTKPVTIVGGGLAGLTLGIALQERRVPVTILEAGRYPRHRVCGEFISGRGLEVLDRLGLTQVFKQAGATYSSTARFYLGSATSPVRQIHPPALCLSRFDMDELLADRFCALGGDLRENTRWNEDQTQEAVVLANGRRLQPIEQGWRWFGLKVHARQIELEADLEMHGSLHGYVGLSRLPANEVNVCGLFRTRPGCVTPNLKELLRGKAGTSLNRHLAKAVFDEKSFCSVAGLSLCPRKAAGSRECRLGDALTMIPPVTGNGMSMAFEAGSLAIEPMYAYARGDLDWDAARKALNRACDAAFRKRLFWAQWLQSLMFSPLFHDRIGSLLLRCDWLWNQLFTRTR